MADLRDIVVAVGARYLNERRTTPAQRKALTAIARCRTEEMGSVRAVCEKCGSEHVFFRSCRNRNCPRCQAAARHEWLNARERELLPVPYFHVVFTVPEELNQIALFCPEAFYAALLRAAGQALLDVARTRLRCELGALTVLHTWGQNLSLHPHVHCVVPGGGFSFDRGRWIATRKRSFLLPVKVLSRRFRTLLSVALGDACDKGMLDRSGPVSVFRPIIEQAARREWVVYAKPPFGGPRQVLAYLSRYTHRVAISNRRIVAFDGERVEFTWRDYADGNRNKVLSLDGIEFLRRFLMHVLPNRFVRIRDFGFLGNHHRTRRIEQARSLIGSASPPYGRDTPKPPILCPDCRRALARPVIQSPVTRPPPHLNAAALASRLTARPRGTRHPRGKVRSAFPDTPLGPFSSLGPAAGPTPVVPNSAPRSCRTTSMLPNPALLCPCTPPRLRPTRR